ncbi:34946_t:CDS:2, partial [Gigaspora margarita]
NDGPKTINGQLENCEHRHLYITNRKNMVISIKEHTNSNQKFGYMPKRKQQEKPNRKTQSNSDYTSSNGYIELQTNNNRKQVEQRLSPTTINSHKNNRYKSAEVDN